jgi:hypothetical protein
LAAAAADRLGASLYIHRPFYTRRAADVISVFSKFD